MAGSFQSDAFQNDAFEVGGGAGGGGSFTIDAVLRAERSGTLTLDAVLRASQTGSFTLDAWVASYFTIDAILRIGRSASLTADAILRASQSGSFTLDAVLLASFTLDAILRAERTGSFTANAVLRTTPTGSITADAILRKTTSTTLTLDAVKKRTQTGSFTASAIKRKTQTSSRTLNAVLRKNQTGSWTIDAELAYHRVGSFLANAIIRKEQVRSFVMRASIANDEAAVAAATGVTQVHIRVDGADITDDVIFSDATFTTLVNGQTGSFRFRVKDTNRTRSCVTGAEVTLDINGVRRFGGYLLNPARTFFFPVEDTSDISKVARVLTFSGVDYNVLFSKRVVYDKARPTNTGLREWPADTPDDEIIKYVFENYTDLFDDGFTTDRVEHVGFPNPDKKGVVGSGGLYFGDLMREVNRLIGAVWYFSPDKDLTWADVDVPNASKSLSDNPSGGSQIGYRNFGIEKNGSKLANDAMVWGAAQGVDNMVFARNEDAASIAAHGRWQYGEFTTQLYKQASVNLRASTIVNGTPQNKRGGKDDQVSWMASTYDTAFVIGQKVSIESEVYGLSDVVPIRKMTITFPTKDHPKFDMILSHEVDEPWNTFEYVFPKIPGFNFSFPPIDIPDIEILDPSIPVCWMNTNGPFDDFNRSILNPHPVGGYEVSDIGCTSADGYTWQGDNFLYSNSSGGPPYYNTDINMVLDGGLHGTFATETYSAPNGGYYPQWNGGEIRVYAPFDGDDFRIEFNLAVHQPGLWGPYIDRTTFLPVFTGHEDRNNAYFDFNVDRYAGPDFHGSSYKIDGVGFSAYDKIEAGGCLVSTSDNVNHVLGATGSLSSVGVIFERHGAACSIAIGAYTHSWTVDPYTPTPPEVGGYAKITIGLGFWNESLQWSSGPPDPSVYGSWFVANSGFSVRMSEFRVSSDKGSCIPVPPRAPSPYTALNGNCV